MTDEVYTYNGPIMISTYGDVKVDPSGDVERCLQRNSEGVSCGGSDVSCDSYNPPPPSSRIYHLHASMSWVRIELDVLIRLKALSQLLSSLFLNLPLRDSLKI
jgi:hypothetical protein